MINVTIPIKTVSEANRGGEHWTVKNKRKKEQQRQIQNAFAIHWSKTGQNIYYLDAPFTIKFTRIAPRGLDGDNLQSSFKGIRDFLLGMIFPEKKTVVFGKKKKPYFHFGHCDNVEGVTYEYAQEKGIPREYAIRIEIRKSNPQNVCLANP